MGYLLAAVLVYDAARGFGLVFDPPGAVRQMPALGVFVRGLHVGLPSYLGWTLAATLGLVGAYVLFLLGAALELGRKAPPGAKLLACLAVAGAVPLLLFTHLRL